LDFPQFLEIGIAELLLVTFSLTAGTNRDSMAPYAARRTSNAFDMRDPYAYGHPLNERLGPFVLAIHTDERNIQKKRPWIVRHSSIID
jgi:hypothetical protein